MNLFSVPFPKISPTTYLKIIALISLSVIFILTVLQPFGTASFEHDYKYPLLAGYGIVIFLSSLLYYFSIEQVISSRMMDKWSVIHEVLFLFVNVIFCLVGCYFYWGFVFGAKMNAVRFFNFILSAFSVAIVPIVVYLIFIYMKYREVKMVGGVNSNVEKTSILIKGTNKKETVVLNPDHLLFVESNNNYVILNILEDEKVTRKMIRCTLNNLLSQLDDNFMKCHRSYIVNLNKILNLTGNITNTKLHLVASETKIPVSRNQVEGLRKLSGK